MNNIRIIREKRGVTQEELARIAGIKSGGYYISKIEHGRTPNKRTAERLADALDVAPVDIFPDFETLRRY